MLFVLFAGCKVIFFSCTVAISTVEIKWHTALMRNTIEGSLMLIILPKFIRIGHQTDREWFNILKIADNHVRSNELTNNLSAKLTKFKNARTSSIAKK